MWLFVGPENLLQRKSSKASPKEIETARKIYAGIRLLNDDPPQIVQAQGDKEENDWWRLNVGENWQSREKGASTINFLPIFQKGSPVQETQLFEKLEFALETLGGLDMNQVIDAYVVLNKNSLDMFSGHHANLATQHILSPHLFMKDDWKTLDHKSARSDTLDLFEAQLSKCPWNFGVQVSH